jgi:hypothetical protein
MKCVVCKTEIKTWRKNKERAFCSKECYLKDHQVGEVSCEFCKKIFYPKYKKTKFCSRGCSSKVNGYQNGHKLSQTAIKKMSETKLTRLGYKNKTSICKNCKQDFEFKESKKKDDRVFCSKKCLYDYGGRMGILASEETKKKIGEAHIGDKNWSWRGGISKLRKRQFSQVKHREWRKSVFERDNFTCQECKIVGSYLEAHHIKPFAYFPDLRYDIDNGITLCKSCHSKETIKERKVNWSNQFVKRKIDLEYYN